MLFVCSVYLKVRFLVVPTKTLVLVKSSIRGLYPLIVVVLCRSACSLKKAEQADKMKKGASPTEDRTFKFEVPFGDMTAKFECPKLSMFGCGCRTLPGFETLDGPDCKALKAILAAEKKWDQKKVDAENFYNKGLGESKQMEAKVKECEEEGNLLD